MKALRDASRKYQDELIDAELVEQRKVNLYQPGDFVLARQGENELSETNATAVGPYEVMRQYKNDVVVTYGFTGADDLPR